MIAALEEKKMDDPAGGPPMEKKKVILAGGLTLLLALGIGGGLMLKARNAEAAGGKGAAADAKAGKGGKEEKNGKAPVPVSVASIALAPISSYITATANLVAENEVKVLSEAEGRVASLLVEEGEFVRKGSPLVQLVRGDAEMSEAKARVRFGNARVAWERAKGMFDKGLTSQGDYDKIVMEKDVAQQELAEAQWRLSKTTVRAPFDGVIAVRTVSEGQHVRPGDSLFTITDFDPLVARIYLPERDVIGLEIDRPVRLTLRATEQVRFEGRIRQISPVVDTATGTVKVTVEAVRPPESVRPGAFVAVDIVRNTRPSATVLPREAVLRELQASHVFVAEKGVAKKRSVTLGIEEGDRVEVLSGVRAGEQVIVAGQGGLKDGSPIKILPASVVKVAGL
ncbi:MAG TPA: efflux RND transporter periplasmic adaptor subunit [Thermoanaerobaculia bacterium]